MESCALYCLCVAVCASVFSAFFGTTIVKSLLLSKPEGFLKTKESNFKACGSVGVNIKVMGQTEVRFGLIRLLKTMEVK